MGQESWSPPCVFDFLGAYSGRKTGYRFCRIGAEWTFARRLFPEFFAGKAARVAASRGQEIRTKRGLSRTKCVRVRDLSGPLTRNSRDASISTSPRKRGEVNSRTGLDVMIAPCEPEPRLDLGDLGAAHGNAMRRRAIEFDHG